MKKDFDSWNEVKKATHDRKDQLLYRERDIRWCRLGTNVGYEQDGTGEEYARPVLVLKGFSRDVCWVVPLTTSAKANPYHVSVGMIGGRKAAAIISQLRLVDVRRLDQKIAVLEVDVFEHIRKAVKALL